MKAKETDEERVNGISRQTETDAKETQEESL